METKDPKETLEKIKIINLQLEGLNRIIDITEQPGFDDIRAWVERQVERNGRVNIKSLAKHKDRELLHDTVLMAANKVDVYQGFLNHFKKVTLEKLIKESESKIKELSDSLGEDNG